MSDSKRKSEMIIDIMAKHEDAVGILYETYARILPQYADFWMTLALQENMHADWIRGLGSKIEEGLIGFNEDRFELSQILNSLEDLDNLISTANEKGTTLQQAVTTALQLEVSFLERHFFEIFDSDSQELKEVFQDLSRETEAHIEKIKQLQTI